MNEQDSWAEYLAQPRYDVSLQKIDDICAYKDFFSTNSLAEAKEVAEKEERSAIVYDRRDFLIVYAIKNP